MTRMVLVEETIAGLTFRGRTALLTRLSVHAGRYTDSRLSLRGGIDR